MQFLVQCSTRPKRKTNLQCMLFRVVQGFVFTWLFLTFYELFHNTDHWIIASALEGYHIASSNEFAYFLQWFLTCFACRCFFSDILTASALLVPTYDLHDGLFNISIIAVLLIQEIIFSFFMNAAQPITCAIALLVYSQLKIVLSLELIQLGLSNKIHLLWEICTSNMWHFHHHFHHLHPPNSYILNFSINFC